MSSKTLGVVAWTFLYYPPQCGGRGMDICIPQRQCGGRGQIHLEENSQFCPRQNLEDICVKISSTVPPMIISYYYHLNLYKVQNFASDEKIVLII